MSIGGNNSSKDCRAVGIVLQLEGLDAPRDAGKTAAATSHDGADHPNSLVDSREVGRASAAIAVDESRGQVRRRETLVRARDGRAALGGRFNADHHRRLARCSV